MCAKATTSRAQTSAQVQEQPQSIPEQLQPPQVPATVLLLQQMVAQLEQLNATLKPLIGLVPELSALTSTMGEIRDLLIDRSYPDEEESNLLNKSSYIEGDDQAGDADDDASIGDSEGDEEDEEALELGTEPQLQRRAAQFAPLTQEHKSLPWGIRPLDLPKTTQRTRERGVQA